MPRRVKQYKPIKFSIGNRYNHGDGENREKYIIPDRTYTKDYEKLLPMHFCSRYNEIPLRECDMLVIKEWLGNRLKLTAQEIVEAITIRYHILVSKTGKFEHSLITCTLDNNIKIKFLCSLEGANSSCNFICEGVEKPYHTQNVDIRNLRLCLAKEANEISKKYKLDFSTNQ